MKDLVRPFPPADFPCFKDEQEVVINLMPAPELLAWVKSTFLTAGSPLYNPEHEHIVELLESDEEFLAFAWASSAAMAKKKMVLGQCEKVIFNQGGWKKARQEQQMRDWFGFIPIYLITIDASFCENSNDREFCRLIEHELYHIGVERDEEGEAICSDHTGLPKHYLAGHDVEVFFGETRQWGMDDSVKRLLEIAKNAPFISESSITACCGTCVIR